MLRTGHETDGGPDERQYGAGEHSLPCQLCQELVLMQTRWRESIAAPRRAFPFGCYKRQTWWRLRYPRMLRAW